MLQRNGRARPKELDFGLVHVMSQRGAAHRPMRMGKGRLQSSSAGVPHACSAVVEPIIAQGGSAPEIAASSSGSRAPEFTAAGSPKLCAADSSAPVPKGCFPECVAVGGRALELTAAGGSAPKPTGEGGSAPLCAPAWFHSIIGHEVEQAHRDLDMLEVFSGQGELHAAFQRAGYAAVGFDKARCAEEDILRLTGLQRLTRLLCRVRGGGVVWFAPPCNMWVWLSSSVHKRSGANPYGCRGHKAVREANSVAFLTAALLRLALARGLQVFLEQPTGSCLPQFPPIAAAIALGHLSCEIVHLGAYGMDIPKPLKIFSNSPLLPTLRRLPPSGLQEKSRDEYYVKGVDGSVSGRAALRSSAAYPRAFGEAMVASYTRSRHANVRRLQAEPWHRAARPRLEASGFQQPCLAEQGHGEDEDALAAQHVYLLP